MPQPIPHRGSHQDARSVFCPGPRWFYPTWPPVRAGQKRQTAISDACCRRSGTGRTLTPLSAAAATRTRWLPPPKGRGPADLTSATSEPAPPEERQSTSTCPTRKAQTTATHPGLASVSPRFQAPSIGSVLSSDRSTAMPRQRHLREPPVDQPLASHRPAPLRVPDAAPRRGQPGLPETNFCNPLVKDEYLDFAWLLGASHRSERTTRFTARCSPTRRLLARASLLVMTPRDSAAL